MGSYTSVHNDTDQDLYIVYGVNTQILEIIGIVTAVIGVVALVADAVLVIPAIIAASLGVVVGSLSLADLTIGGIELAAQKDGYHLCSPGKSYVSEKLTLSLVHQANIITCKKLNDDRIDVRVGAFTVWSGPTNGDVNVYQLTEKWNDSRVQHGQYTVRDDSERNEGGGLKTILGRIGGFRYLTPPIERKP